MRSHAAVAGAGDRAGAGVSAGVQEQDRTSQLRQGTPEARPVEGFLLRGVLPEGEGLRRLEGAAEARASVSRRKFCWHCPSAREIFSRAIRKTAAAGQAQVVELGFFVWADLGDEKKAIGFAEFSREFRVVKADPRRPRRRSRRRARSSCFLTAAGPAIDPILPPGHCASQCFRCGGPP